VHPATPNHPRRHAGPWPVLLTAVLALALGLLVGCQPSGAPSGEAVGASKSAPDARGPIDIHSLSHPERVRVTHADIDWEVDFAAREIRGSVTWTLARAPGAEEDPLTLDTRGLTIEEVTSDEGEAIEWELGTADTVLGTPLVIRVGADDASVRIEYRTGPASSGLQWLDPPQTASGTQPFLFSQAQSILARTMLPCQDSPGVRVTYDASVRTPMGITAVMAAQQLGGGEGEPWKFRMPQPIPSYLIAIAAGDITFRSMGPRTGVFAEAPVADKAAWEFAETEKMIEASEELFGPYRWDRYDLIVLPPSFPFGGMENPRLTFATPTVLAGDRSLVSLVAHELAHSWSGNLVTNATWSDFWMNEGFTVYLERRVIEKVYGRSRSEMEAVLGMQDLQESLTTLEPGDTVLHNTSLAGRDPDDAFSDVPYEKGYLLLRLLEEEFGRESFDPFLRKWFDDNAFQSRTTSDFEMAMDRDLFKGETARKEGLKIAEWLNSPGLPDNAPRAASDAFEEVKAEADAFVAGSRKASSLPAAGWNTHEWRHFLRSLPDDLASAKMADLDAASHLTDSGNSEILMEWLMHAIKSDYTPAYPALEDFLTRQGRRKFLQPLYTEMAKSEAGKARAMEIYTKARPTYHPISTNTIDGILEWGK
jgi:leukotriene A-4 hydrolase/aminopeptidase